MCDSVAQGIICLLQSNNTVAKMLKASGLPVWWDEKSWMQHMQQSSQESLQMRLTGLLMRLLSLEEHIPRLSITTTFQSLCAHLSTRWVSFFSNGMAKLSDYILVLHQSYIATCVWNVLQAFLMIIILRREVSQLAMVSIVDNLKTGSRL